MYVLLYVAATQLSSKLPVPPNPDVNQALRDKASLLTLNVSLTCAHPTRE